jgi:hypothetical protein
LLIRHSLPVMSLNGILGVQCSIADLELFAVRDRYGALSLYEANVGGALEPDNEVSNVSE